MVGTVLKENETNICLQNSMGSMQNSMGEEKRPRENAKKQPELKG